MHLGKRIDAAELASSARALAGFFEQGGEHRSARWFGERASKLTQASSPEEVEVLAADLHRALQGGQGGPFGFVITDSVGRIDRDLQVAYRATLNKLWGTTRGAFRRVSRRTKARSAR